MSAPALDKVVQAQLMTSDGWRFRRLLVFSVAWFLCALIAGVTAIPALFPIAHAVLGYAFPALMAIVMAYVFGAAWDDRDKRARAERLGTSGTPGDSDDNADTSLPSKPAQ